MGIWDLAKPVIAQVHGYCLAGGSELATGCDLVYVAEDAQMGYPAVRFGVPDMHFHAWFLGMRAAMEMMVTGDSISGLEAVRLGWANRAFPVDELDAEVLEVAERIALDPVRRGGAQQAHGASGDGGHGPARRRSVPAPSCARSAPRPATFETFIDEDALRGPDQGAAGARRPVRRLPHPERRRVADVPRRPHASALPSSPVVERSVPGPMRPVACAAIPRRSPSSSHHGTTASNAAAARLARAPSPATAHLDEEPPTRTQQPLPGRGSPGGPRRARRCRRRAPAEVRTAGRLGGAA